VNDKTAKPHEREDRSHNQWSVGVVEHDSVPIDGVLVADRMAYGCDAKDGQNYNRAEHHQNMGPD
jgi:hypothetical protein